MAIIQTSPSTQPVGPVGTAGHLLGLQGRPDFMEPSQGPILTERVTKSGKTIYVDISAAATAPYGFMYQDCVSTPLGEGTVIGVNDNHLWFHIGKDTGLSYFGQCLCAADFERRQVVKKISEIPRLAITAAPTEPTNSFRLKKITLPEGSRAVRIVLQAQNGACPLIGLANALILRNVIDTAITFPAERDWITAVQLSEIIAGVMRKCFEEAVVEQQEEDPGTLPTDAITGRPTLLSVLGSAPHRVAEYRRYMANVSKNVAILDRGLCVSPIFCGVDAFDYISTCLVFPILNTRIFHAWVVDPQDEVYGTLFTKSYDTLLDIEANAAAGQQADTLGENVEMVKDFLARTALQVTPMGLQTLTEVMKEDEVAVYFGNNHFSTIQRHGNVVYRLVTDVGYQNHADCVWQQLTVLDDSDMYNAHFVELKKAKALADALAPRAEVPDRGSIIMQVMQQCPQAEFEDLGKAYDQLMSEGISAPTKDNVFLRWNEQFGLKGIEDATPPTSQGRANHLSGAPQSSPSSGAVRGGVVQGTVVLSVSQQHVANSLMQMGFDEVQSRKAALAYTTLEAAANSLIGS